MRRLLAVGVLMAAASAGAAVKGVAVVEDAAKHRVDVTVEGLPFTSYLWDTNQRKPVLYPIVAADGTTVTRGFPFAIRPGERVDHPHHAGLWFNYGSVNGFDFWNNSDAIAPDQRAKYGVISLERVVSVTSGKDSGELVTESGWTTADGKGEQILEQTTRYVFSRSSVGGNGRSIDVIVTLKALADVTFNDDKEGLLGMRVAHFLESATEKGGVYLDANGVETKVKAGDTTGATGIYRTSEGKTGDAAWGTRGRWCELTGTAEGRQETVAMLDHVGNPGYPAYWHARGYGLFAVNPLGAHIFDPKAAAMDFRIAKGASATFRYRVLVVSGAVDVDAMNRAADAFDAEYR